MARSFRHYNACSITKSGYRLGEKFDKQRANRALRRACRIALMKLEDEILPLIRDVSNIWGFRKDGKRRFDPTQHPECLRK